MTEKNIFYFVIDLINFIIINFKLNKKKLYLIIRNMAQMQLLLQNNSFFPFNNIKILKVSHKNIFKKKQSCYKNYSNIFHGN